MPTPRKASPRPSRTSFSDEVRDAIERDGMSPHAIAKASGVDPGVVSRFLAGRRAITTDSLDRLAATLGLHLAATTCQRGRPRKEAAPLPSQAENPGGCPPDSPIQADEQAG